MKRAGIIGGLAPPSTVDYYNRIIEVYRQTRSDYPSLIINSVDLEKGLRLVTAGQLAELTHFLGSEIDRLVAAGVDFVTLAANTPHIVFEQLAARCPKPMISIVDATFDAARKLDAKTALLFGTRFTMEAGFYQRVFDRGGIRLLIPNDDDRTFIHDHYLGELIRGVFKPEVRDRMLTIARSSQADVLILGGTELPLLLRDGDVGMPMLDTTEIHVQRIVAELIA